MSYATRQDMIDRFAERELIQLTDRDDSGDIDADVLNRALADADGKIDGYLIGRYALPLATVPVALTGIACDIARYMLYDNGATEQVRSRYEDAIAYLTKIGEGRLTLGLDSQAQPTATSGGAAADGPDRVFTRESLKDY